MSDEAKRIQAEGRARLLNVALPVLTEVFAESRAEAIGALTGSFRLGESSEKRDLHAAKLCAIEELESKINEYVKGGQRHE
jgi:hypothetical protein